MADINQQILAALEEGHPPDVILQAIKQRGDDSPAHAAWYKNYQSQTLDARSQQSDVDTYPDLTNPQDRRFVPGEVPPANATVTGASSGNTLQGTGLAGRISKHLNEASLPQLGAEVAGVAAGGLLTKKLIERGVDALWPSETTRIQKEQNAIRAKELEVEREKQLRGETISPYEQARIETEKVRAQRIQQQIDLEARQFEMNRIKAQQAQAAADLAAQERAAAKLRIKDPVEQRLEQLSKSQGYGGNIAPAGNTVPQINTMQPQPVLPPEVRPTPVAPSVAAEVPITPSAWALGETSLTPTQTVAPINQTENIPWTADEIRKRYPESQTEWSFGGKKLNADQAAHYLNTGELPSAPVETPNAAPVAETPKAELVTQTPTEAAPPPENAPKAAVVPEEKVGTTETGKGKAKLKWPGGAEGFAAQQLGATKKTFAESHAAALEMLKQRTNGILTQSSSGGAIHQMEDLSKMYEHYTGEPLAKTAEGKWARIPDTQIAQLHAGIESELRNAVKGGQLKTLGKGALAAAALLGITEAVQAAQKGNFGPLKEAGFDVGIGALGGPAVLAGQVALTGKTTASGLTKEAEQKMQNRKSILARPGVSTYLETLRQNVSPQEYETMSEAYLASNPKAPQSDWQKYVEHVQRDIAKNRTGSGRGIAPPSAYQR